MPALHRNKGSVRSVQSAFGARVCGDPSCSARRVISVPNANPRFPQEDRSPEAIASSNPPL